MADGDTLSVTKGNTFVIIIPVPERTLHKYIFKMKRFMYFCPPSLYIGTYIYIFNINGIF